MNTRGGCLRCDSASTSTRVESTRLLRNIVLRSGVQRPPAILAPFRFTTASKPSIAGTSTSALNGFHCTSPDTALPPGRTRWQTVWPSARNAPVSAPPTSPEPPEIKTFILHPRDSCCVPLPWQLTYGAPPAPSSGHQRLGIIRRAERNVHRSREIDRNQTRTPAAVEHT